MLNHLRMMYVFMSSIRVAHKVQLTQKHKLDENVHRTLTLPIRIMQCAIYINSYYK